MDFNEKKQLVGRYIDKIYSQLESDLVICKKFEVIQDSFQVEYSKLCNYAIAIRDDLKSDASDKLEKIARNNKIFEDFDGIARNFKIPEARLEESNFFVTTTTIKQNKGTLPSNNRTTISSNVLMGFGVGLFLGGGLGALIGKEITSIVIGAAVGGVVGGTVGQSISSNNNESKSSKSVENNETLITKKVSQEKIHDFIQERNKKIKRLFLNYIDEFENAYNS